MEEFNIALLIRLDCTYYEDPSEAITHLKQTSTISAYQDEFEKLSHHINNLPQIFLVGCFIARLKDDIRLDVKIKQPRHLIDFIGVAKLIEEKLNLQRINISGGRISGLARAMYNRAFWVLHLLLKLQIISPLST